MATADLTALTRHDVIQRVCERLCRRGDHEPIWGLLRHHSWAQPRQLLLLLAQHLQLGAGAPWVVGRVVVWQLLDGDEGGLKGRRRGLGLRRGRQRRLLRRLRPVPVEDGAHLRKPGVIAIFSVGLVLRAFLFVIVIVVIVVILFLEKKASEVSRVNKQR